MTTPQMILVDKWPNGHPPVITPVSQQGVVTVSTNLPHGYIYIKNVGEPYYRELK